MISLKTIGCIIFLSWLTIYCQEYDNRVYHIVRFIYSDNGGITTDPGGGGTAFFITKTHFISAYHCFKDFPLDSGKVHCELFLLNADNDLIINYKLKIIKPEYDFVLGEIDEKEGHNPYVWEYTDEYSKNDSVYNLGFPIDSMKKNFVFITSQNNGIRDSLPVYSKKGVLLKDTIITFEDQRLSLKNRKVIKLNYLTSKGDSGGPVVLKSNNKVIGYVSLSVNPETRVYSPILKRFIGYLDNNAYGIRFKDIMKFINE